MVALNPKSTPEGIILSGLERRIENSEPFLEETKNFFVAGAQKAFREQRFGASIWPKRYPSQSSPKFNVAGALEDANAGKPSPKANRFNDSPAGVDAGTLRNTIVGRVVGKDGIIFGSPQKYATRVQAGGTTIQRISDLARKTIAKWLKKAGNAVRRLRAGGTNKEIFEAIDRFHETGGPDSPKAKKLRLKIWNRTRKLIPAANKQDAVSKMGFMLAKPKAFEPLAGSPGEVTRTGRYMFNELVTKVIARPFAGLTLEIRDKVVKFGERWFGKGK